MDKVINVNDNDTWTPIGWQAARVLAKITEEQEEHRDSKPNADRTDEQKREGERRDILYRLREIEAFERRASGIGDRPARKRRE
jgi:hypothetical protein